ncbi:MAG: hypothetical protein HYU36_15565 [Planctomycetes bacterium]|nr:hypothetical protein [Planctomycetota bacterium]
MATEYPHLDEWRDYYFRMRTYVPEWGMFTGQDRKVEVAGDGSGNYQFANGNPLRITDPSGLDYVPVDKNGIVWAVSEFLGWDLKRERMGVLTQYGGIPTVFSDPIFQRGAVNRFLIGLTRLERQVARGSAEYEDVVKLISQEGERYADPASIYEEINIPVEFETSRKIGLKEIAAIFGQIETEVKHQIILQAGTSAAVTALPLALSMFRSGSRVFIKSGDEVIEFTGKSEEELKQFVLGQAPKGTVALDANALIRSLEKGELAVLDRAIASRAPTISITAAK